MTDTPETEARETRETGESNETRETNETNETPAKFVVRIGETEEGFDSRELALSTAKERSKDVRGPVIVESESERSTYRYIAGELAQFVMETRR